MQRVKLAKKARVGEVLAGERGRRRRLLIWLVRVEEVAFMYSGQKCTEDGIVFISGGCYIKVRCIERFPLSSPSTFKLSTSVLNENAEGALHSSSPQMQAPRPNHR